MLPCYRLRAFTLIECLMAILVLTGSIQVYQALTTLTSAHVHQLGHQGDNAWLLFCQQLRSELSGSQLTKVSSEKFLILKDNQALAFGKSKKDDFRKTSADGRGYQPMLYGLKTVSIAQFGQTVSMTFTFKDGRIREFLYAFEATS